MGQSEAIKLFEEKKVRTIWDDVQEKWYFSVLDVIQVLADSVNPTDYFKKMRQRDEQLASFVGTNCPQVLMSGDSGKRRKTLVGDAQTIFRIIQSIPSPKAEPFKQWMAMVAAQRLDQMQDPELSIEQAILDYTMNRNRPRSAAALRNSPCSDCRQQTSPKRPNSKRSGKPNSNRISSNG